MQLLKKGAMTERSLCSYEMAIERVRGVRGAKIGYRCSESGVTLSDNRSSSYRKILPASEEHVYRHPWFLMPMS
jgi:hypothetical protein